MHGTRRSKNFKKSEKALSRRQVQALPSSLSFFSECREKCAEKPVFFNGKPCIAIVAFRSMCSIYVAGTKERSRQNLASQMEGLS
ncbi:hypothetical protein B5F76_08960 [Desulfovibrio sp. An276]|nr:hypothetical protein B5F76_08960 [Desulfovibrio sp. An276]